MQTDEAVKTAREAEREAKRLAATQARVKRDSASSGRGTGRCRDGRGPGTRGTSGGRKGTPAVTTTSRSQGSGADRSGPPPGSLPFPAATSHY